MDKSLLLGVCYDYYWDFLFTVEFLRLVNVQLNGSRFIPKTLLYVGGKIF